ncbi:MAG: hypothetical protein AAFU03_18330, partial [Bacteroidota bacterium]
SFNEINDIIAGLTNVRVQNEINDLQDRYNAEIEAAEGNADRQAELREELAEREAQLRQEAFEEQKKFRIASVLAAQAEGIINILSSRTGLLGPLDVIFKATRIGILAAQTALQVATISSQRVAAKGAIVEGFARGESHNGPHGGIPVSFNGQSYIIEAGEFVDRDEFGNTIVINKRSSAANKSFLESIYGQTFQGKAYMMDMINRQNSWGSPLLNDGGLITPSLSNLAAVNQSFNTVRLTDDVIAQIAASVAAGARIGTAEGASDANRRNEREDRLRRRTG